MNIKNFAAAALFSVASISSAFAGVTGSTTSATGTDYSYSLRTLANGDLTTSLAGEVLKGGTFTDTFTFSPSVTNSTVLSSLISFQSNSAALYFTDVSLNGISLFHSEVGETPAISLLTSTSFTSLTQLVLTVTGTSTFGGSYGGNLQVSAVPEPATYGMLLAGVAVVGFMARRRKAANGDKMMAAA